MKNKYLIPALVILILAGCYKEQEPVQEGSIPRKGTFNFSSSTGEVTKVLLNSDNTLFWASGDKIAVYDYKAGSVYAKDIAVLTGGERTAVGTFTPSTLPLNTSWYNAEDADNQQYNFYAYYPGGNSAPDPTDGKVTVSVAASQQESVGIGKYIVSWASANTTKQNLAGGSAPNFAFAPKSALLKLAIQNNTAQTTNITRIIITATGGNIAGDASLVLADGTLSAGDSNVITCILASPIRIAPNSTLSVPVYVSVLPCAATNLAIVCAEDEGVYGSVNIAMSSIDSGKVYSKTAVLSSFQSQRFVIANSGDQSAKSSVLEENNLYYGTANCVLVSDVEHTTSFNVNIQLFRTEDGYSRSDESAGPFTSAVTSAKIIWTEGGLSSDANFKITAGDLSKITLSKTSGTTGNALLGIYDADGSILWSYHIWVPNDASVNTPGGSHSGKYTEAFNLALGQIISPTEPYMYFQWGRKDPMGRANAIASDPGLMATSGDGPSESKTISALATGHSGNNLAYARQNPTVFITINDELLYDWYPTTSGTTRTEWNKPAGQNDNLWKDTAEGTIYDPCPEGYHVPGNNNLWYDAEEKTYFSETMSWTILNFQYVLGGFRRRADAIVRDVAGGGYFWSSEAVGGDSPKTRLLYCNSSSVVPKNYDGRAFGFGVRCVKGGPISSYESKVIENSTDQTAKSAVLEANNLYYGTANCVLVDKEDTSISVNIQLFKTSDGYSRSAASASPFTSAVTSAKIIWAESGLSTDASFKITNADLSKVTLSKTKGVTGNALVGIYDADGRVLWSYHIWVPNDASVNTPGGSHSGKYSEAFNLALGQIDTPNEPYMYYQWGRKDPLGRANAIASNPGLKGTSGDGPSTSKFISALATGHSGNNLAYARQNPMVFITNNDELLYDWYPTTSGTTRTDGNKPAGQNDNLWKDTTIGTIYDPCPEGYHVPGNNNLWHDAEGKTYSSETKSWTILNFQYVLGGFRDRVGSGLGNVAGDGGFWSSEAVGGSSIGPRYLSYNGSANNPTANPTNTGRRASGFGVRCVKE